MLRETADHCETDPVFNDGHARALAGELREYADSYAAQMAEDAPDEEEAAAAHPELAAALAAVDAAGRADLAFLSTVARDYGADSTPAANLRELLALRKLADVVRAL